MKFDSYNLTYKEMPFCIYLLSFVLAYTYQSRFISLTFLIFLIFLSLKESITPVFYHCLEVVLTFYYSNISHHLNLFDPRISRLDFRFGIYRSYYNNLRRMPEDLTDEKCTLVLRTGRLPSVNNTITLTNAGRGISHHIRSLGHNMLNKPLNVSFSLCIT